MTRQDFINDIDDFDELKNFCRDYGCECCDDVYSDEDKDERINEDLIDIAYDATSWQDLLCTLRNIPTNFDWYLRNYYNEYTGLSRDDFHNYKNEVLEWADENDIWEDDEEEPLSDEDNDEEEPLPDEDNDEDEFTIEDEPISIGELMGACNSRLKKISDDNEKNTSIDNESFKVFVSGCVTIMEGE